MKQRLLAAGLILYLDPHGKKGKSYGVRIPPAEAGPGMAGRFRGGRNGPPPDAGAGSPSFDPAPEQPPVMYVEVLGPGEKESHIVDLAGQSDFEVARGDNQGTLLIEIAIPIRTSDEAPLAAPIDPAEQAIGLGLETPDVPSQGGHGQLGEGGRGGGRTGGGMGGMGGGMGRGGGMGGYPSGGGPDREGVRSGKEVKVWATLEMVPR